MKGVIVPQTERAARALATDEENREFFAEAAASVVENGNSLLQDALGVEGAYRHHGKLLKTRLKPKLKRGHRPQNADYVELAAAYRDASEEEQARLVRDFAADRPHIAGGVKSVRRTLNRVLERGRP